MEIRVSLKEKKVFFRLDEGREVCIKIPDEKDVVIKLPEGVGVDLNELIKNLFERKEDE